MFKSRGNTQQLHGIRNARTRRHYSVRARSTCTKSSFFPYIFVTIVSSHCHEHISNLLQQPTKADSKKCIKKEFEERNQK